MAMRSHHDARCRRNGTLRSIVAAASDFVRDTLGRGFLEVFLAIKRQEAEKFGALVSDRDYEWYLDTV